MKNEPALLPLSTSPAETLNFSPASVSLVTSGQAAHWFDLPKFYAEVDKVLVKGKSLDTEKRV